MDVPLKIEKLANEVTYARLKQAMAGVSAANYGKNDAFRSLRGGHGGFMKETSNNIASSGVASALIDVLFYKRQPMFHSKPVQWSPINQGLDPSQRQAVEKALSAVDVCLVHGPPGTGKTTAVVRGRCYCTNGALSIVFKIGFYDESMKRRRKRKYTIITLKS